jgi:hypothetical protein
MKVSKRDWLFILAIVALLAVLAVGVGRERGKKVPADAPHRPFSDLVKKGRDREGVEKGCLACHGAQGKPLPKGHPPKEQCLICHKLGSQ